MELFSFRGSGQAGQFPAADASVDYLEAMLEASAPGQPGRAEVLDRLRSLVSRWAPPSQPAVDDNEVDLDAASDEEIFNLLDNGS